MHMDFRRFLTILVVATGASGLLAARAESQVTEDITIDNTQAEVIGGWTSSMFRPNYYGNDYQYRRTGTGTTRVVWRPQLHVSGIYAVFYWLPDGATDRASNAINTVHHAAGVSQMTVDQRAPSGGVWRSLGTFAFPSDTTGAVVLTDQASGTYVIADAIKFVPVSAGSPLEIIVDNDAAVLTGVWNASTTRPHYQGHHYLFAASGVYRKQHGEMDTEPTPDRPLRCVLPPSRRPHQPRT